MRWWPGWRSARTYEVPPLPSDEEVWRALERAGLVWFHTDCEGNRIIDATPQGQEVLAKDRAGRSVRAEMAPIIREIL